MFYNAQIYIRLRYENVKKKTKINQTYSPKKLAKQVHPNMPKSEHQNKILAFKLKCIAFFQSSKCLKRFTLGFQMKDHKNRFYKS